MAITAVPSLKTLNFLAVALLLLKSIKTHGSESHGQYGRIRMLQ